MGLIKVSDFVARFLVEQGIEDLFLVSGGGIMHLLDSVGRQNGLRYWCNYHEQACAIAAEGYAKIRRGPGACLVTVGPGGVNALSGIAGAWVDSVPVLVLTGQVRREIIADYSVLRQKGPQEADLVGLASHVTKYAVTVMAPEDIRYELEKALYLATSGRPGPVWVDLPLDIQGAMVEEADLRPFPVPIPTEGTSLPEASLRVLLDALRRSRRPLLLAGSGLHWAHAESQLLELLKATGLPIILTHTAKDLLPEDHPQNMGVFGGLGQRRANFALQNADLLVGLGAGLCLAKTGFNVQGFAPGARKILVDIDEGQLHHQPLAVDLRIQAHVKPVVEHLLEQFLALPVQPPARWIRACEDWKLRYPVLTQDHSGNPDFVNTYIFMDRLAERMVPGDVLVTGIGTDVASQFQTFRAKSDQRLLVTGNWGAMGWDLPATVGACIAHHGRTVLVTGDGSIQWNIQELLTVGKYRLPIMLFVFNNDGYTCIKATQTAFFQGFFVGAEPGSGVGNPDFRKLAEAYGLGYARLEDPAGLEADLDRVFALDGPILCEVMVSPSQGISPKASSFRREDGSFESRPLEDMAPFLAREELYANMHLFDDEPGFNLNLEA
jgi:acetolactate synthase-1/2/3 large subunit